VADLLGLPLDVFVGELDVERLRLRLLGFVGDRTISSSSMVGTGVYEASRCFLLAGDLLLVAGFMIADLGATGFLVGELDLAVRFVGDLDLAVFFATVMASERGARMDDGTRGQTDDVVA